MAQYRVLDGGIAGATLALRLRLRGHDVTVSGTAIDTLPDESFTLPAPFRDLFLKSGAGLDECVPFSPAEGRRFRIDGCEVHLPASGQQAPTIAGALGADAGRQWMALMADAADVWSNLRHGAYRSERSLRTAARTHLRDPRLRDLLRAYLAPHGITDERCGDAALVFPYLDQTFGRWRFDQGLAGLEHELRQRCLARGVTFEADTVGAPISVRDFWQPAFAAPRRRWQRPRHIGIDLGALGLPWIGMAAEYLARATPRAR